MRIKLKELPPQRFVRRFAIFPVKIGRTVVWLERYYIEQHKCHPRYGNWYVSYNYLTKEEYERSKR